MCLKFAMSCELISNDEFMYSTVMYAFLFAIAEHKHTHTHTQPLPPSTLSSSLSSLSMLSHRPITQHHVETVVIRMFSLKSRSMKISSPYRLDLHFEYQVEQLNSLLRSHIFFFFLDFSPILKQRHYGKYSFLSDSLSSKFSAEPFKITQHEPGYMESERQAFSASLSLSLSLILPLPLSLFT